MAEESSWGSSPSSGKRLASWSNSPPPAKHHHGESSAKEPQVVEDSPPVPDRQKHNYTRVLKVGIHLKEPLDVVCTSEPEEANKMIQRMRMKLGGMPKRNIGVDVEYTREDEPPQIAAVLQLCVEDLVLVYHITAATEW